VVYVGTGVLGRNKLKAIERIDGVAETIHATPPRDHLEGILAIGA
jgi:hypothetical protein